MVGAVTSLGGHEVLVLDGEGEAWRVCGLALCWRGLSVSELLTLLFFFFVVSIVICGKRLTVTLALL
jgi:hypothetical protein